MEDTFWSNIFRNRNRGAEAVHTILKRVPIFDSLRRKELYAVERILHRREYKAGETIFFQGDPGAGMYIIESGRVRVIFEPTQQLLAELHEGDFFGELALMDESPRSATVIAREECKMLCFFQSDLLDLIDRSPRLGVKIVMRLLTVIGERLKKSNEQVMKLQQKLYELNQRRKSGEAES